MAKGAAVPDRKQARVSTLQVAADKRLDFQVRLQNVKQQQKGSSI
jgi:hypothetical protein